VLGADDFDSVLGVGLNGWPAAQALAEAQRDGDRDAGGGAKGSGVG
jgi:hypothetical protein